VHPDATLGEQLQGGRVDQQPPVHALGQDDRRGAVDEQFGDVGRLDTRCVLGPRLGPVPFAAPARVQLGVLDHTEALDADAAPGQLDDPR
jgi:hypothetical protein